MIKQLHCLFLLLVWLSLWNLPTAQADNENLSGCCKAPSDLIYWCNDLPRYFDPRDVYQLQTLFGKPQNKCYGGVWIELQPIIRLTNCETGTITRRFQVSAHYDYEYCEQTITIKGKHNYEIRFPADIEISCGQTPPPADDLLTYESDCDLLAVSVTEHNFATSGANSGCGKILRTYRVINWCEYDGISDPVVIDRDEDCDGAPGDEEVWVLRREDGYAFIDRDNNEENNNPKAYERSTCSPGNPKGYWRKVSSTGMWTYTQHVKINDKVAPVIVLDQPAPICSYSNTCDVNINIPFTVTDDCTPNNIKIKVFIDGVKTAEYIKGGTYKATGKYKVGAHQLEIHANDACGNPNVVKVPFKVVDCKAPAPICINGITVTLMPTPPNTDADGNGSIDQAAMTIWASDLIASQVTDCSGIAGYSINRVGETPSLEKKQLVLTCEDRSTVDVEVYAWDNANNFSFCRTYILVQTRNNICSAPAKILGSVAGSVQTEEAQGLADVNLMLISKDSSVQITSAEGSFYFDSLSTGNSYKIIPRYHSDFLEGVGVSDLVVLQNHIMGNEPLTSPYRLIAADVNRSGDISVSDMLEVRKIMLGVADRFSNNTSWRFVDAAYVFPDPTNPWKEPFPESIDITNLPAEIINRNFIAIKIGDLNSSVINERRSGNVQGTTTANLLIQDQALVAGETIDIPISFDAENIDALGFELNFDPAKLEMATIRYDLAKAAHINTREAKMGKIRVVWNKESESYSTTPNNLLTIQFRAIESAQLREVLHLSNQHLPATAQQKNGTAADLALLFTTGKPAPAFVLYPNAPNPFRDETVLSFQLPEASLGTVRIYDLTGKLLWQQSNTFAKGYNQIRVSKAALAAEGVLLYTLQTASHQASGKMIVLPN